MNRRNALKSLAAIGAAAWAGAAHAADAPLRAVRITLPSSGSAGSVWQPLVDKLGLAQEYGLNLEWVSADPGKMQVQLSTGAIDIGVFGAVGLSALIARGSDILLFGPALNNHGRWLVKDDSPYQSPRDLLGKTIATTAETSETYQQAALAAHLSGITLKKDIKVIHGSPTANLALFERGDVDAVITLEPTASRLVARGARQIARVADIWKEATGSTQDPLLVGLSASKSWLDNNRDTAAKVVALFKTINGHIRKDPALLTSVATEIGFKDSEKAAIDLLPSRLTDSYATTWDSSTFAIIDKQIEVAAELGIIAAKPPGKIYVEV
ncbi:hypothetical protein FACS1894116_12260 [Betaproteobacteria bacterium]|nr:hypothetical protein FACS1894116_12260 [Betaproteobacteria bacterium]GHU30289.1 hypothetical protein FACS189497_09810 [Betaproteobacteria bacterium]